MQTGLLLNSLICLLIFGSSLWLAKTICNQNKKTLIEYLLSLFWITVGFTWFFVGVGLIIYKRGYVEQDMLLNQFIIQALIFIQLSLGVSYAIYRFWQRKEIALGALTICLLLSGVGYYFLIQPGGFSFGSETYFSVEYKINDISWNIFQAIFIFGLLFLLYDLIKTFIKKLRGDEYQIKYLLITSSIIIYSLVGYFDNLGFNANWTMVFFRSFIILSILIAYTGHTIEEKQEDKK